MRQMTEMSQRKKETQVEIEICFRCGDQEFMVWCAKFIAIVYDQANLSFSTSDPRTGLPYIKCLYVKCILQDIVALD